jgi:ComF family protein
MVNCWAKLAGNEDMSSIGNRIERQVLSRRRATLPQASLGRKQRASNIKNAFELNKQTEIVGKHVLLVDDVYTTGATVNECARVLMDGGAGQVDVLTLARAV